MPKFTVYLPRIVRQSCTIVVDATDMARVREEIKRIWDYANDEPDRWYHDAYELADADVWEANGDEVVELTLPERVTPEPKWRTVTTQHKVRVCPECAASMTEERDIEARSLYHWKCACGRKI